MRGYSVCILILFLTSSWVNAQTPVPRIVPIDEFLNKNKNFEAYDVEFDSKGYGIVASNQGLFKFSGSIIKNDLIPSDKKTNSYSFALYKDHDGIVWLGGPRGVSYVKNDTLFSYPVPDSILKMARYGFESLYKDKDGILHLAPRNFGYFTMDEQGRVTEIESRRTTNIHGMVVKQLADKTWFHYSLSPPIRDDSNISIYLQDEKEKLKLIKTTDSKLWLYESSLVQHSDGNFSMSIGCNSIVRFTKEGDFIEEHVFDFNIIKLFVDSRNDLWIGTLGNGTLKAKNSDFSNLTKYLNDNSAVVAESYDGGLWFKSRIIGLGYLAPNASPHYSSQTGHEEVEALFGVKVINDKLFLTTLSGDFLYLDKERLQRLSSDFSDLKIFALLASYDKKNETYWFFSQGSFYSFNGKETKQISIEGLDILSKTVKRLKVINGRVLGITKTHVFEIKDDEIVLLSEQVKDGYFEDFTMDNQGNIWLVSDRGVSTLRGTSIERPTWFTENSITDHLLFTWFAKGYLWAISDDNELFRYNEKIAEKVVDQNGESIELFNYTYGGNGTIWGTNANTNLLKLTDLTNPDHLHVDKYELPIDNILGMSRFSLAVQGNTLYLSSAKGLFLIPIHQLVKGTTGSKLIFRQFVNNEEIEFSLTHSLDYFENDIRINFDAINYRQKTLTFSYKLEGYDNVWNETKYKEIRYTNLSPGTYKLRFRSKMKGGDWYESEAMTFTIEAPFWETTLFRILIVILIILLIVIIMFARVRYVRRKEKEKSKVALELVRLEMRALKAQINPHFIFNSITSAMFYLAKNENHKVESYLQRFSKLVRKVLESSDKSYISLIEEMELIRLYVKLESEQFEGDAISLDVSYDGDGIEDAQIPPTLIQPYIENAIQHGLKNKHGERSIKLSFKRENKLIKIVIEDNGIGRAAAKKEKPFKENKSFGMLISSRRIELMNKNNISHVQVDDLYDESNKPVGTRVSFTLPFFTEENYINIAN